VGSTAADVERRLLVREKITWMQKRLTGYAIAGVFLIVVSVVSAIVAHSRERAGAVSSTSRSRT
jgi:hypothetical protein